MPDTESVLIQRSGKPDLVIRNAELIAVTHTASSSFRLFRTAHKKRFVLTWEVLTDEGDTGNEDAVVFDTSDEMTDFFNNTFGPFSTVMKRLYAAASDAEPALSAGVVEFID